MVLEAGWSTGLLGFYDDFETLLNGTVLCGAMVALMPARTNLDLIGGGATCGIPSAKLLPLAVHLGCSEADTAYFTNLCICMMFPPVAVFWRKQMRDMYSIKEQRELKMRESGRLYVPGQLHMNMR